MRVARWGNSLAVRLPVGLTEEMRLKEGDEVELKSLGANTLAVERNMRKEEALARIAAAQWPLPPGYKFDREEANAR